jgi:hypothetical protein
MENMSAGGVLPFSQFGYTDQSCQKQPQAGEREQARQYRIKGFQRLSYNGDDQRTDMLAMKQQLSHRQPRGDRHDGGRQFHAGHGGQDTVDPHAERLPHARASAATPCA